MLLGGVVADELSPAAPLFLGGMISGGLRLGGEGGGGGRGRGGGGYMIRGESWLHPQPDLKAGHTVPYLDLFRGTYSCPFMPFELHT